MHSLTLMPLLIATWQTIYLVFISSFISILSGLAFGVWLHLSNNRILGFILNITRSIPFIILMIALIPMTRLIVGTSIGTNAAIIPLAIAAIPFFSRITESALAEISPGVVEAANAMGTTTWQKVYKVLIPEALPSLIKGATLTIITLIGYSAMAGAVGGGGLGELAIDYGYQRFNLIVMLETVVILVIIVQLTQLLGNRLARKPKLKWLGIGCGFLWLICIGSQVCPQPTNQQILKVGIVAGPQQQVLQIAKKIAQKRYGINIKIVVFDDYQLPNAALNNGEIDANIFQHVPFLQQQIKEHGYKLTPIAKTFVYPFGFYSYKIVALAQLKYGAIVAIPSDPSNEGRALRLLQQANLIKLRSKSLFSTPHDIISNPKNLQFKALSAAQLPRVLKDADLVGITNDYIKAAKLTPQNALLKEGPNSPYANVIVVRTKNKNKAIFNKLITIMHSKEIITTTENLFPHEAAIPAWK